MFMTFSEGTFNVASGATTESMVKEYSLLVKLSDTAGGVSTATIKLNIKSAIQAATNTTDTATNSTTGSTTQKMELNQLQEVVVHKVLSAQNKEAIS